MLSKKVLRLIKKSLDVDSPEEFMEGLPALMSAVATGAVLSDEQKACLQKLTQLPALLETFDTSFNEAEDKVKRAERNITLSLAELSTANDKLLELNTSINAMIDSLGEGYFVVKHNGNADGAYSRVCEAIFAGSPSGRHLFDLLKIPDTDREDMQGWLQLALSGTLHDSVVNDLGPKEFINADGRTYSLRFRLQQDQTGVRGLVVIATDKTDELAANQRAQEKMEEARMVAKLAEGKEQFQVYVRTANEIIEWLKSAPMDSSSVAQARFDLHTLKGGSTAFLLKELENTLHELEVQLLNPPAGHSLAMTGEVIEQKLNSIISQNAKVLGHGSDWLDEVIVHRKQILNLWEEGTRYGCPSDFLDHLLKETIAVNVKTVLSEFESAVQVTAGRLSKMVHPIEVIGEDVLIPFEPYRRFFSVLVHLFRNAVDHGIESPESREAAGKDPQGKIQIQVGQSPGLWWMEVRDDGGGVNVAGVRTSLSKKIGAEKVAAMSDEQILHGLLENAVSSRTEATLTSGMGVGLSAVGEALNRLGGRWVVTSNAGKGSTFRFELPMVRWHEAVTEMLQAA